MKYLVSIMEWQVIKTYSLPLKSLLYIFNIWFVLISSFFEIEVCFIQFY